jgi:hypothetical protein
MHPIRLIDFDSCCSTGEEHLTRREEQHASLVWLHVRVGWIGDGR